MNQLNSINDTYAAERRGVSRRTALRTALWSAPVVSVAAAAPAFAASGALNQWASIAVGGAEWDIIAIPTRLQVSGIRVRTARGSAMIPANGLTVTVTFPNHFVRSVVNTDIDLALDSVSSGWNAGPTKYFGRGNGRYATVTFTYTSALMPGSVVGTSFLNFRAGRAAIAQPYLNKTPLPFSIQAPGYPARSGLIIVV